ncbi:hypothetical protein [Hyphomicrobium sp.]|uniref:hypothetical protein n=1 Tax=Hyphomicrobium sp. TaxID=82 RepID=UPI0025BEC4D0|nr:hypothetical protein [Hyphomicrobium sp.]MCC7251318.1 hypothetical protein [Hyphomicrobium sp.]
MTYNPTPDGPRSGGPGGSWGAIGLFIVGVVILLALVVTLLGPTSTQQEATNVPASPPTSTQTAPSAQPEPSPQTQQTPPDVPQPAQ